MSTLIDGHTDDHDDDSFCRNGMGKLSKGINEDCFLLPSEASSGAASCFSSRTVISEVTSKQSSSPPKVMSFIGHAMGEMASAMLLLCFSNARASSGMEPFPSFQVLPLWLEDELKV